MSKYYRSLSLIALYAVILCAGRAFAGELTASGIMERSYNVYRGDDEVARLRFTITTAQADEKKIVMAMAWKNYKGRKGVESKIIMFNEFPPDTKDVAFMAWLYILERHKKDDMWLYLPELRTVRKLSHEHGNHKHEHGSDKNFAESVLKREELQSRHPQLDTHRLLGTDTIGGQQSYVIESRPKALGHWPYSRVIRWITRDTYLPLRVDYYTGGDRPRKRVSIQWRHIENAWVWDKVTAVDRETGARTVLDQTDIRINAGIRDNIFSKRMMKLGATSVMGRINR